MGSTFCLVYSCRTEMMLPVSDMVGILQCNVCEAAWARLGRPLSPLFWPEHSQLCSLSGAATEARGNSGRPVGVSPPSERQLEALEEAGDPSVRMQKMQTEKWAVVIVHSGWRKEAPRNHRKNGKSAQGLGSRGADHRIDKAYMILALMFHFFKNVKKKKGIAK